MTLTAYDHPMQQGVALFHRAFGHPDRIDEDPQPLPAQRIDLRLSLIREEGVDELGAAILERDPVGIVDALIDTVYVALGGLVEMGQQVRLLPRRPAADPRRESLFGIAARQRRAIGSHLEQLESALREEGVDRSVEAFSRIVAAAHDALIVAGLDPEPFFDEVQRSNMSKLGADGLAPEVEIGLDAVVLVYRDEDGEDHEQPLPDITSAGTLIDPDSGDDLELRTAVHRPSTRS